jgi:hypothetical protein
MKSPQRRDRAAAACYTLLLRAPECTSVEPELKVDPAETLTSFVTRRWYEAADLALD